MGRPIVLASKTISIAAGTGVGVGLIDLILDGDLTHALIMGVAAALIAAVLVVVLERRG